LQPRPGGHAGPLYAREKALTILRDRKTPEIDPAVLAVQAMTWIVADDARAHRFLALTGLTPEELREGLHSWAILAAGIEFLLAHEPDLIAAAAALEVEPTEIVRAGEALRG
jgi:hypothetical protein